MTDLIDGRVVLELLEFFKKDGFNPWITNKKNISHITKLVAEFWGNNNCPAELFKEAIEEYMDDWLVMQALKLRKEEEKHD